MRTIAITTRYLGSELPGLVGCRVRVFRVLPSALGKDVDVDAVDYFVSDDETLARLGGVTKLDRVDVAQLRPDGTESCIHCDRALSISKNS
jgi:hypothetical protein